MNKPEINTFESETQGLYADDPEYYRLVKKYAKWEGYAEEKNKLNWNKRKTSLEILQYLAIAEGMPASSLQGMKAKHLVAVWKAAKALHLALKEAGRAEAKNFTKYSDGEDYNQM